MSLFTPEWVKEKPNFDLVLIYYTPYVYAAKGEKYHLIKSFIESNIDFISNYTHIWIPDNDVSISTENINKLFETTAQYHQFYTIPPGSNVVKVYRPQ